AITQLLPSLQPLDLVRQMQDGGLRLIEPAFLGEHHQGKVVIPPRGTEDHSVSREPGEVIGVTREQVIPEAEPHPGRLIRSVDVDPAAEDEFAGTKLADGCGELRVW